MKQKLRAIFIDGEVNEETVSDFKNELLFSSVENKKFAVSAFQMDRNDEELIKAETIKQIVEFYNRVDSNFLKLESDFGLNVWFLEHFRINHHFINLKLKQGLKKSFLSKYPKGEFVSINSKKANFSGIRRVLNECLFIFLNSFKTQKKLSGTVLVHNEGGTNFKPHELFGQLSSEYSIFKIRSLFDLKRELPERIKMDAFDNSDRIFGRVISLPQTWFKLFQFRRSLDSLFSQIAGLTTTQFEQELVTHLRSKRILFELLYLRYLSFKNYFESSSIDSVVLSDENSPQQKVILYACKAVNIKSFAVQHGAIYKNHFAYTYGCYKTPPLLPTLTFTWGEYYNDILLQYGGYSQSQLMAVGSLRKEKSVIGNENREKTQDIQVLFATQPIPNEELRRLYLIDVFQCIKNTMDEFNYNLVIRPHPNEKSDSYFLEIANSIGLNNFTIERNVKIENHFEQSDILITAYSTVGAEFVEYYKPIIVLDYQNEDLVGYVREGVGIQVTSKNQLCEVLRRNKIDVDSKAYDQFVKRFFHSTDGNAGKRIIETIESY